MESTVGALLTDVGLAERANSYPHMLSGGERQRVASGARPGAQATDPADGRTVLEPGLAPARSRPSSRPSICSDVSGTTTILVTHDPSEALRVADRIGVLSHGRLVQFGTAAEIYRRPCSPQMACSFGAVNTMAGRRRERCAP